MATSVRSLCACGCGETCATTTARWIAGHVPEQIAARDSVGLWVQVKMGEEDPAYAHVTTTKETDTLFSLLTLADHPTCGHCRIELPQQMMLPARLTQPPRGLRP